MYVVLLNEFPRPESNGFVGRRIAYEEKILICWSFGAVSLHANFLIGQELSIYALDLDSLRLYFET